jgi:hypothetical protein
LLGYAAATVSAWVLPAAYLTVLALGPDLSIGPALGLLPFAVMLLAVVSVVLLIPALLVIAVTEIFSVRRAIVYVAFGAVVLFVYRSSRRN